MFRTFLRRLHSSFYCFVLHSSRDSLFAGFYENFAPCSFFIKDLESKPLIPYCCFLESEVGYSEARVILFFRRILASDAPIHTWSVRVVHGQVLGTHGTRDLEGRLIYFYRRPISTDFVKNPSQATWLWVADLNRWYAVLKCSGVQLAPLVCLCIVDVIRIFSITLWDLFESWPLVRLIRITWAYLWAYLSRQGHGDIGHLSFYFVKFSLWSSSSVYAIRIYHERI